MTAVMNNQTYRIRRSRVTCIGNLEKGEIVRITSIQGKMCEITDGYYWDYVPIKELERVD